MMVDGSHSVRENTKVCVIQTHFTLTHVVVVVEMN